MVRTQKKPYIYKKSRYTDICLGVRPVVKVGNSCGVTIKQSDMKKYRIKPGDEFIHVLIKRTWNINDELSDRELREYAQFLKWKKEQKKDVDEAVEDILNQNSS